MRTSSARFAAVSGCSERPNLADDAASSATTSATTSGGFSSRLGSIRLAVSKGFFGDQKSSDCILLCYICCLKCHLHGRFVGRSPKPERRVLTGGIPETAARLTASNLADCLADLQQRLLLPVFAKPNPLGYCDRSNASISGILCSCGPTPVMEIGPF